MSFLSLWLPILLSAGLVFIVSSILHMFLPLHKNDFATLPQEDALLGDMRSRGLRPGNYAFPCARSMSEMGTPEMQEKYRQGPVGFMFVLPDGPPAMAKSLVQWFLYTVIVGVFVAYVAELTLSPGAEYWSVFRVTGTLAFMAFAMGEPMVSIWQARKWSTTLRHMFDGAIYSLTMAGAFAGFWLG
jgi:hypothetical protein